MLRNTLQSLKPNYCIIAFISSAFLAFGLYHVHSISGVTEGGVLGLTLLLEHWFDISPSVSSFVLNLACYALGWKLLGKEFIAYSAIATVGFSVSYKINELFEPVWPELSSMPLLSAIIGAIFVGLSVGICVRVGGAPGGDDALAMSISHLTKIKIEWIYLFFDLVVLGASISYISIKRIGFSLLTVIISGQIIGFVQKIKLPAPKNEKV